jgi:pilus assembly protein CpaF
MQTFAEIFQIVIRDILTLGSQPDQTQISEILDNHKWLLTKSDFEKLEKAIANELSGYGPLNSVLSENVTDVLVNSPDSVWVDNGGGLTHFTNIFESADEIAFLARRLASLANSRLDDVQPFVDGLLPDGTRLHALLPPVAGKCAKISLRFPSQKIIPIESWMLDLNESELDLLNRVVRGELSFVISGATGSGKTTLLKSILNERPSNQRILILEEASEIQLSKPNIISLVARNSNTEGMGEFTLQKLVRQSLRMRPDSIVIGEVRGIELIDFLLAVSSGHGGSGTTIHANPGFVERRIGILAGLAKMDSKFAIDLFKSSIDVVIHCERRNGKRIITTIAENHQC